MGELCARLLEVPRDQEQPPPGGKVKLFGVRGHRHRSGHTRVRTLFTTGEAHVGPPTSSTAVPEEGDELQDPPGGGKAPYMAAF